MLPDTDCGVGGYWMGDKNYNEPVKPNDMKTNAHEWGPELARIQALENQVKEQRAQIAQITKVIGELTDKLLGLAVATRKRFEKGGQNHV